MWSLFRSYWDDLVSYDGGLSLAMIDGLLGIPLIVAAFFYPVEVGIAVAVTLVVSFAAYKDGSSGDGIIPGTPEHHSSLSAQVQHFLARCAHRDRNASAVGGNSTARSGGCSRAAASRSRCTYSSWLGAAAGSGGVEAGVGLGAASAGWVPLM